MPALEAQIDYALSFAKKIQSEGVKSVMVSEEATAEFNKYKDAVMETLTFSANCNSWYARYLLHTCYILITHTLSGTRMELQMAG